QLLLREIRAHDEESVDRLEAVLAGEDRRHPAGRQRIVDAADADQDIVAQRQNGRIRREKPRWHIDHPAEIDRAVGNRRLERERQKTLRLLEKGRRLRDESGCVRLEVPGVKLIGWKGARMLRVHGRFPVQPMTAAGWERKTAGKRKA